MECRKHGTRERAYGSNGHHKNKRKKDRKKAKAVTAVLQMKSFS